MGSGGGGCMFACFVACGPPDSCVPGGLLVCRPVGAREGRFFVFAGIAADVVTDAASAEDCWAGVGTAGEFVVPMSFALGAAEDSGVTCCAPAASVAGCAASDLLEWEATPPLARDLNQLAPENPPASRSTMTISAPR